MTRITPDLPSGQPGTAVYDAWNRLRQIVLTGFPLPIVRYEYDGLNRRTVGNPTPLVTATLNNQYFYYNENWQELEVRGESSTDVQGVNPLEQFVWHPCYIDPLATRFYDVDFDGIDVEQHYFVHDANYNVTAAVDDTGAVVERYHYSAYGEISYRNPDFTAIGSGNSTIGNHTTYTGRRREPFGGIYHYRNRYYHPQLGKFLTRDPIGYEGSPWNLYQYVGGRPTSAVDPMGEADCQRLTVPSKKNIFGLLVCPKVTVGGKRIQAIKVRRIEYWPEKKPTVIIECMVPCGSLECPDPDCQDCIQVSLRSKGPFGVEIQLESCQCDPP